MWKLQVNKKTRYKAKDESEINDDTELITNLSTATD